MASPPFRATRIHMGSFDTSRPLSSSRTEGSSFATHHPQAFVTKGSSSFDTSQPTDFCIKVEDESIAVHKELLRTTVLYFQCLFESVMQEVQNEAITLQGFKARVVRTVIKYTYGETINIEWEDVADHLDLVEFWQMTDLKNQIETHISKNISPSNCLYWFVTGRRYGMEKLVRSIVDIVATDFKTVALHPDFNELDIGCLTELLTKDLVYEASCEVKLKACIDWVLKDEDTRKCHYMELVQKMELTKYSENFTQVLKEVFLKTSSQAEVVKPYTDMLLQKEGTTEKGSRENVVLALCKDGGRNHGPYMLKYDVEKRTGEDREMVDILPNYLKTLCACCSTPYGIYIGLGQSGRCYKSALLHFPSLAYVCLPDLPYPVLNENIVFAGNMVHIFSDHSSPESSTRYTLDMKTLEWTRTTTLNVRLVCSMGDKIYVITKDNEFYCYDTQSGVWSRKERPPKRAVDSCCAVACGEEIFVIRGGNGDSAKYTPATDTWTKLTWPRFWVRFSPCQAAVKDNIVIIYNKKNSYYPIVFDVNEDCRETGKLSRPRGLQRFVMVVV